jgi:hypothetical protein
VMPKATSEGNLPYGGYFPQSRLWLATPPADRIQRSEKPASGAVLFTVKHRFCGLQVSVPSSAGDLHGVVGGLITPGKQQGLQLAGDH